MKYYLLFTEYEEMFFNIFSLFFKSNKIIYSWKILMNLFLCHHYCRNDVLSALSPISGIRKKVSGCQVWRVRGLGNNKQLMCEGIFLRITKRFCSTHLGRYCLQLGSRTFPIEGHLQLIDEHFVTLRTT